MTVAEKIILEPATQAFVDSLATQKGKPIYELSYKDARKVLEDAQAKPVTKLPADIEDKVLPVGPTGEVSVRILSFRQTRRATSQRSCTSTVVVGSSAARIRTTDCCAIYQRSSGRLRFCELHALP